jgi:hypothetical protein
MSRDEYPEGIVELYQRCSRGVTTPDDLHSSLLAIEDNGVRDG